MPEAQRCQPINSITLVQKATQDLPRDQVSLLVQLRTGHIPLQKYLHRIGKVDSPKCLACQTQDEMVQHYLLNCPAYRTQRGHLERAMQRAAWSIKVLLVNPKAFPHLLQYMNATRHFRHKFKDTQ